MRAKAAKGKTASSRELSAWRRRCGFDDKSKEYAAAVVTIRHGEKMNKAGRKRIATWLREQADFLVEHGPELAPGFRARYITEAP